MMQRRLRTTMSISINKSRISSKAQKGLSGILIALLLLASPLPVFAETASTTNTPVTSSTTTPAIKPVADTSPSGSPGSSTSSPSPALNPVPTPTSEPSSGSAPVATTPVLSLSTASKATPALTLTSGQSDKSATSPSPTATTPKVETVTNTVNGQNNVTSTATSGNASVTDNKKAGNAKTGDAKANATVVNVANSNTNFGTGSNFNYYTKDITVDQNTDLLIDPSALLQGGTTGNGNAPNLQTAVSLTDILNNISLTAKSGDAAVSGNKKAGDATSGNASALANIINVVGSAISAQNSFLGVVNIYANLKGNILVPQSFVDSLINGSNTTASGFAAGDTTIANNISASANSGNATVIDNRKAGDATSGNAATSLTVYNLTGQEVVAKNSLLVFVNVLGKWVGMIVQAPGSNSAAFGKDITTDKSANNVNNLSGTGSTTHITNNISVTAASGDATVSGNKKAGAATSGNAAAGVNLVNITNSNFKLGDWFGALFINVLGSWVGDFGIKAETPAVASTETPPSNAPTIQDVRIFRFDSEAPVTPTEDASSQSRSNDINDTRNVALTTISTGNNSTGSVLGANSNSTTPSNPHQNGSAAHSINIDMVALVAMVGALTLLIALGSLAVRRKFVTA